MGKSNKNARDALESIYGKKDMFVAAKIEEQIDELNKIRKKKIKTYKEFKKHCRYTNSKEKTLEKMLSYHHLRHRSDCGDSSIENGAVISALPHSYLHSLPRDEEEIINNMLREYKQNFNINCATLVINQKGIEAQPLQEDKNVEIELPEEIERGYIELEPMTEEDLKIYEEHKRERNERVFKKFKGEER